MGVFRVLRVPLIASHTSSVNLDAGRLASAVPWNGVSISTRRFLQGVAIRQRPRRVVSQRVGLRARPPRPCAVAIRRA